MGRDRGDDSLKKSRKMFLDKKNYYNKCKFFIFVIYHFSIKMIIFFLMLLTKYFVDTVNISTITHSASIFPSLLPSFYILEYTSVLNNQIYQLFLSDISVLYYINMDFLNLWQYKSLPIFLLIFILSFFVFSSLIHLLFIYVCMYEKMIQLFMQIVNPVFLSPFIELFILSWFKLKFL